jgi:hypothetical protein
MSLKSLKRFEGELTIDHRAGNGLPEHIARMCGYEPSAVKGGKLFEAATITCKHCKGAWVKNPDRIRPREFCRKCDHYICDGCAYEATQPDYIHRSFEKVAELALESAHRNLIFTL